MFFMESIWHSSIQLPQFPKLHRDLKTDVLIIGGGLCGILCAHSLQKAGVFCAVAEAGRICSSTSGNTTAKVTAQHGLIYHKLLQRLGKERAHQYLQANLEAVAAYRALAEQLDFDFVSRDNFIFSTNDPNLLEQEMDALVKLGYPAHFVAVPDIPVETAGAVGFEDQGQMHPLKLAAALAKELTVFENTPVRSYDGNLWHTPEGKIQADKVIVATHFPILNKHGGFFMKLYQHRSYVVSLENAPVPRGMYADEDKAGYSFREYGGELLLGGGGHRTGKSGGAWKILEDFAGEHYPQASITHRWAAQDCMSLDGMPYIGVYSKNISDVYVATGFNKWGMTGCMTAATVLTDLILGQENPYEALFSPSRAMMPGALTANMLHSAVNLLTPTAPRCPHMGCALKWNPHEHSWDCPCHGSRFSKEGKCLEGPSTNDFKKGK